MKLFISADIEGTAGITLWEETEYGHPRYGYFARQMTREVSAACEGAMESGATDILVKDAHDSACNLLPELLPEEVRLFRGWGSDFLSMMTGLDQSFGGVFFTGYHAGAGMDGNPLAHTVNTRNNYVRINGQIAPEMVINGYAAAYFGVPVLLVTGDKALCELAREINPNIETVAVSEGCGRGSISIHPNKAVRLIREAARRAVAGDGRRCMFPLPEYFEVEISFKDHYRAKAAAYPGVTRTGPNTVAFGSGDYMEVLRMLDYVL